MDIKYIRFVVALFILAIGCSSSSYAFHGTDWTINLRYIPMHASVQSPAAHPLINPLMIRGNVVCYDFRSGQETNCKFTYKAAGVRKPTSDPDHNGGHLHGISNFPLTSTINGFTQPNTFTVEHTAVKFDFDKFPNDKYMVGGNTMNGPFTQAYTYHPSPNFTGAMTIEVYIETPPGWVCPLAYDHDSVKYIHNLNLYVARDLQYLSDPTLGDHYEKVRGGSIWTFRRYGVLG